MSAHDKRVVDYGSNRVYVDIPVILPEDDVLQLDEYVGHGLQPGETELPNDGAGMSYDAH